MAGRTSLEKLTDQLLLLYLINDISKRVEFLQETRLQKLVFISEREMFKAKEKGFNYYFIKLLHGPYSAYLKNDLLNLVKFRIVGDRQIALTERGLSILRDFSNLFERNQIFVQRILDVNRRYGILGLDRLLRSVYNMQSPLHRYRKRKRPPKIASLSLRTPLVKRIKEDEAKTVFHITPEEASTLEIYLDPEAFTSLSEAGTDKTPTLTFDEVF